MTSDCLIEQCKLANNAALKEVLNGIMDEYAKRFCEMYDFQPGWWVSDARLGVYCTDGIEVSIGASELVFCVDNDIDGDTFCEWWQYVIESAENPQPINLRSWCNGARPEMLKSVGTPILRSPATGIYRDAKLKLPPNLIEQ